MKTALTLAIAMLFALAANLAPTQAGSAPAIVDHLIEHGGGCRKSSPPGQCCHMDNKAGSVYYH